MALKTYKVLFTHTALGREGVPIGPSIRGLHAQHGEHWPIISVGGGQDFQVRDVQRVGAVWRGVFAKLREDAPHKVNRRGDESRLPLDPGDHLIDKCHFLYRERLNVLIWQYNRAAGGLSSFQSYLSQAIGNELVTLPLILHSDRLDEVLAGHVYELQFDFSRPADNFAGQARGWWQSTMDLLNGPHAAMARITLKAPKHGFMQGAAQLLRQMQAAPNTSKLKARLTDETALIDIVTTPLRESFQVEMHGLYPLSTEVFQELEAAYDRQRQRLTDHRAP